MVTREKIVDFINHSHRQPMISSKRLNQLWIKAGNKLIIPHGNFLLFDPIFTMEWPSNTIKQVQQAIVDFLVDVAPLQAHWYSICTPEEGVQVNSQKILRAFPSISSLMCIDEQILNVLAGSCKCHSGNYIMNKLGWEGLIRENMLSNVEITSFKILNKARWLICICSWRKNSHPHMTQKEIWSASLHGDQCVLKLRTSLITLNFAMKVEQIDLPSLHPAQDISSSDDTDTYDSRDIILEESSTVKDIPMTLTENNY